MNTLNHELAKMSVIDQFFCGLKTNQNHIQHLGMCFSGLHNVQYVYHNSKHLFSDIETIALLTDGRINLCTVLKRCEEVRIETEN